MDESTQQALVLGLSVGVICLVILIIMSYKFIYRRK